MALVAEETRQRLQAEIADLQQQLAEIDEFLADAKSEKIVPRETKVSVSTSVPASVDTPKKFNTDDYTEAGKGLPENFDTDELCEACGIERVQARVVLQRWQARRWITRVGHGEYRKTENFGDAEKPKAEYDRRFKDGEPDPLRDNPHIKEPTPEVKQAVARLNVDAARAALEKRLESKQRQREDCIDGSASADVLDDEIEQLEEELSQLEQD